MGLYIPKKQKPDRCMECAFHHMVGYFHYCWAFEKHTYMDSEWDREKMCPLIDIPPHGRLIDADVLNDSINRSYPMTDRVDVHNGYAICQEMIKLLPTIIPAEEGET